MMRRLVPLVATLGAVAAFYAIAPDPESDGLPRGGAFGRNRAVADANIAVWNLGDTLRALNNALQRARAWETARAIAPDPALTKVISLPGLVPATASVFAETARDELAALERPRVPIRIVLVPDSNLVGQYRKQVVIPQSAEQPCVVVIAISGRARNLRAARNDRLLGTCGFYAKFGYPGAGMQGWLEATRGIGAMTDSVIATPRRREERYELRGSQIGEVPAEAACLAGDDEGCAQSILDPSGIRRARQVLPPSERTVGVLVSYSSFGWYGPGQTLASMRAHVGDASFEKIWASAEEPAAAFKTATGEHIAVFARPILLRDVLPHQPGPLRGGLTLFLGLGIGATAATLAIKRTRRERS